MRQATTLLTTALVGLIAPSFAAKQDAMSVKLKDITGKEIGTVKLTQLKHGVKIDVDAKGLAPGSHAFHFHQNGTCAAPDFKSAGDHFNPEKHEHGFDAAKGPHDGDMPNVLADQNGKVREEIVNTQVTLGNGPKNSLLKPGGTALVIHAKSDDYSSQPAGNAGDRVACAEIK